MAIRFLHIADIHLGFDHYNSPLRTLDFFHALRDVIQRHAIDRGVDFVLVAGDLFEHRQILPSVLNQAQVILKRLQQAGIPVLAIEGNHDNRPYGVKTSWLRYLAEQGWLHLLEPDSDEQGEVILSPWASETRQGGYIDLPCGVRVVGSRWYGSMTARVLPRLATAISQLPGHVDAQIALLHHGMDGQIARYEGALRYGDVLPLQQAGIHYLALGHIHKTYALDNWIFNPGSLEANSMAEYDVPRGAYLVTVEGSRPPQIHAELIQDYRQRAYHKERLELSAQDSPPQVHQQIFDRLEAAQLNPDDQVMLEIKLTGELGFPVHELDQRRLQTQIQALTGALVTRLNVQVSNRQYAGDPTLNAQTPRRDLERQVLSDLLANNASYRSRSAELAQLLITLKDLQLSGAKPPDLYDHIHHHFDGPSQPSADQD